MNVLQLTEYGLLRTYGTSISLSNVTTGDTLLLITFERVPASVSGMTFVSSYGTETAGMHLYIYTAVSSTVSATFAESTSLMFIELE